MALPDPDTCYRAVACHNVSFHPSAASAQRAGYRACKRCRPDASPGSPDWDTRSDLAGRALRLIADGVVDRDGVTGLATRLGYSERQINRTLIEEVGAGPITLRLPYREPMTVSAVLDFLGAHAVPGLESYSDGVFRRAITAPGGMAVIELSPGNGAVACTVRLHITRDLVAVVSRVRRLLDLDADPVAVDLHLGADPTLAPLIAKRPGIRAPGCVDGFETAVRTIVGQQVSVSGARTVLGRVVAEHGPAPLEIDGRIWQAFPSPATLAALDPATLPMPRARGRAIVALAEAFATGSVDLDAGTDRDAVRARLLALPGIGPWTADYLLMRALGHPDVLLDSDLVVRKAAIDLSTDLADGRPDWAPWRSYATYHLWAHLYADLWSARP